MSGATAALAGAGAGQASGGATPNALNWKVVFGQTPAATQALQVTGISVPISVSASLTGGASLSYILNGSIIPYTGAFVVHVNDYLAWQVSGSPGVSYSGSITVTNATTSTTIKTVTYFLSTGF